MINQAALNGPAAFPWWPDWRGQCAAIIASGPSVKKTDVETLRDRINVMAIKVNVDLAPWSDVVYGCDGHWWIHRNGLPKFKGIKLTYGVDASDQFKDVHRIDIERRPGSDVILTDKPARTGSGGNSGFQALNLCVQFGATGILLIGFDMRSDGNSPHWYKRNEWPGASNPIEHNYARWRLAFEASVPRLQELGVDVVNCSDNSTLQCYRKASVEEALKGWGL